MKQVIRVILALGLSVSFSVKTWAADAQISRNEVIKEDALKQALSEKFGFEISDFSLSQPLIDTVVSKVGARPYGFHDLNISFTADRSDDYECFLRVNQSGSSQRSDVEIFGCLSTTGRYLGYNVIDLKSIVSWIDGNGRPLTKESLQ